jgi:IS605 OrfB family transposase
VQLRYGYRLYPTPGQRESLARAFGCARVVFNDRLRARQEAHAAGLPYISDGDLSKRVITQAKAAPERAWLGEVSAVVLQQALADLNTAYRNFFTSLSGKRKGPKVAPPRYRSKKDTRQAIRRHAKVADARREFHHQESTRIIRDNQTVIVEDLAVGGLARTRLAKSVHDAGWSSFVGMLEYKARLHGRTFHRIDRWFPSSKLCSACGGIAESLPLHVREWTCPCGATHDRDVNAAKNILAAGRAERLNASHLRGRDGAGRLGGGQVRPPLAVAQPGEAGSHRGAA